MFVLISCEEVIDVPLDESEPKLVIDASILWAKGTTGNNQRIRISETTPFYEEETEGVEDANVRVASEGGEIFEFIHQGNGYYTTNNFAPQLNMKYNLEVMVNNEIYMASEVLTPVTSIDYVEQTESGGFSGEDIEIKAYYTDPAGSENYYLFEFRDEEASFAFYEDEFTNGNQIFGYYSTEDIKPGDIIGIQIEGISKSYYEYLFILRSQVGSNDGGPFETMPATVKGNIVNRTNADNYPFGYFRLSEVDSTSFTVD